MTTTTHGPFDTDLSPRPMRYAQRYWGPDATGFNNRAIPAFVVVAGDIMDWECFRTGTVWVTENMGVAAMNVSVGCYDLDDRTLLLVVAIGIAAPGATTPIDFGTATTGVMQGRVFKAHDLRCASLGFGLASNATALLYMRT